MCIVKNLCELTQFCVTLAFRRSETMVKNCSIKNACLHGCGSPAKPGPMRLCGFSGLLFVPPWDACRCNTFFGARAGTAAVRALERLFCTNMCSSAWTADPRKKVLQPSAVAGLPAGGGSCGGNAIQGHGRATRAAAFYAYGTRPRSADAERGRGRISEGITPERIQIINPPRRDRKDVSL